MKELKTLADYYTQYQKAKNPKLKESSIKTRDAVYRIHILPYFEQTALKDIDVEKIEEWHSIILSKNLSPNRTRQIHTYFSSLFNYFHKIDDTLKNPCKIAGMIGSKRNLYEMQTWSHDEYKKVIKFILDEEIKLMLEVFFWTGIRKSELYGLTWKDFDESGILSINKAYVKLKGEGKFKYTSLKNDASYRKIELPKFLTEDLKEFSHKKAKSEPIFQWSKKKLEESIRTACAKASVKRIRVHDLRHSHATMLINSGLNLVLISRRLGHAKVSTTLNLYGHYQRKHVDTLLQYLEQINVS